MYSIAKWIVCKWERSLSAVLHLARLPDMADVPDAGGVRAQGPDPRLEEAHPPDALPGAVWAEPPVQGGSEGLPAAEGPAPRRHQGPASARASPQLPQPGELNIAQPPTPLAHGTWTGFETGWKGGRTLLTMHLSIKHLSRWDVGSIERTSKRMWQKLWLDVANLRIDWLHTFSRSDRCISQIL